jgi:acyl carrier protein
MAADEVRARLRAHILGTYLFTDDPAALGDDQSFQETRIIDSMGMMQLIQFVETDFEIKLRDLDLVPDKLDSVNRLVTLVVEKQERQRRQRASAS